MERMTPPQVPDQPVDVLTEDQVRALLDDCKGRAFVAVRDTAIIRVLIDTGIRRAELLGMTVDDLDLDQDVVYVLGKGRRERVPVRPQDGDGARPIPTPALQARTCNRSRAARSCWTP